MELLKVHGSGNTFYLIDIEQEQAMDYITLAKWLCRSDNEGGADGLLIVCPSQIAHAKMRVINADGSEASMCGNGLRCVARYVCEKLRVNEATIETMKVCLHVKKEQPIFGSLPTYAVEISPVSFDLETLPMTYKNQPYIRDEIIEAFSPTIRFTAVSVPNPHLIGLVNEYYIKHQSHQYLLANYLNNQENAYCPDGVNVSYMYPMTVDSIYVRTFERGVGFTNACGTAMTASALVAKLADVVQGEEVIVYNLGGFVKCRVQQQGDQFDLLLIGNATVMAYYQVEKTENAFRWIDCRMTDEQVQYEACQAFVNEQTAPYLQ